MSRRLSRADAAWLHMDRPHNLMVITSVMRFDQPLDLRQLRRLIAERLVERYPKFGQHVVESRLGSARWENDPDFAIEHHVHHVALPAPGDNGALQEMVSDLMTTALDRRHPLWQMYLVDGYDGGSALIIRMHHCIADGVALAQLMLSVTDGASAGDAPPSAVSGSRRLDLRRALSHLAVTPSRQIARAGVFARYAGSAVSFLLTPADHPTALKGEPGIGRRVAWTQPVSLARIKTIARTHDATVNDVLLAAVTGALHHYLQERDGPIAEIQAMIPVNLRPLDEPVPQDLGNHFGLVFLALPVTTRGARRRLVEVHRRMEKIKSSREAAVSHALLRAAGLTPEPIERRIVDMVSGKGTAVMTNVRGPLEPVFLAGTPVQSLIFWAPTSGHIGMSVSIFSYRGEMTVGLMVDAVRVPTPVTIIAGIEREIEVLEAASRRAPGGLRADPAVAVDDPSGPSTPDRSPTPG